MDTPGKQDRKHDFYGELITERTARRIRDMEKELRASKEEAKHSKWLMAGVLFVYFVTLARLIVRYYHIGIPRWIQLPIIMLLIGAHIRAFLYREEKYGTKLIKWFGVGFFVASMIAWVVIFE